MSTAAPHLIQAHRTGLCQPNLEPLLIPGHLLHAEQGVDTVNPVGRLPVVLPVGVLGDIFII